MKSKYLFVVVLLLVLSCAGFGFTRIYTEMEDQEEGLLIVTSFYPMYVATQNVVGDCPGVQVSNLSEPQTGCLHDYQLTPQDMILLSQADIFVVNGGGIESFITDVAEEYPDLTIITAGEAIFSEEATEEHNHEAEDPEHDHEAEDPEEHDHGENAHVWMSIYHYSQQIEAIRDGLIKADPSHQQQYQTQGDDYLERIDLLWQEAQELHELTEGTSVIILHEAFEFLAEDYGLQVTGELNLDEEVQVSASQVADLVTTIRQGQTSMILAEELYGVQLSETLKQETDCQVYYLDTLVRGEEDSDSWIAGMERNIAVLRAAMESSD